MPLQPFREEIQQMNHIFLLFIIHLRQIDFTQTLDEHRMLMALTPVAWMVMCLSLYFQMLLFLQSDSFLLICEAAHTNPITPFAPSFKAHSASNCATSAAASASGLNRPWRSTAAKSPGVT